MHKILVSNNSNFLLPQTNCNQRHVVSIENSPESDMYMYIHVYVRIQAVYRILVWGGPYQAESFRTKHSHALCIIMCS